MLEFPLVLLLLSAFQAMACPEVGTQVEQAYELFNDAEAEEARKRIAEAHESLACQQKVVSKEALLSLYQLDALVALTLEDRQGSVYAIIRSVTVDPSARPPEDMGPEIGQEYEQWSARLSANTLNLVVTDSSQSVWVDGRPLGIETPLSIVEGEHLIQSETDGVFRSVVVELAGSLEKTPEFPILVQSPVAPVVTENSTVDIPAPPQEPSEERRKRRRRLRLGVTLTGLTVALTGGGLIGAGALEEWNFQRRDYDDPNYGSCTVSDPCYAQARADAIRADARFANQLYMTGYGLLGAGAATMSVGLFAIPVQGGGVVGLQTRW